MVWLLAKTFTEQRVQKLLVPLQLQAFATHGKSLFFDDNSLDGTLEIAKQLAKVYREDKIVRKPFIFFLFNCDSKCC